LLSVSNMYFQFTAWKTKENIVDGLCDVERMENFCSKEQIHGFEDMLSKMEILITSPERLQ
jgi:hypothetical protein